MIAGAVFDLDDTLYLERDFVRSGFRAVANYLGGDRSGAWFDELWAMFTSGRRDHIFDELLVVHPEIDAAVHELVEVYRDHRPHIELLPDARLCLEALASDGIGIGVVTDGRERTQLTKCAALGLDSIADPILVSESAGQPKPGPLMFRMIEQQWGLAGRDLVYVGDNPAKDFTAPQELHWLTVQVIRPGQIHQEGINAAPATPDVVLDDLANLMVELNGGVVAP